ncbi:MAG TPA: nicotinate (nicotinamide) nucleotide adenylyltransferase [Lachnospiraceae bacterium]|nr:nicotinate (nicotinamide) nucleotide adenylyltransferase [Lachnospiraceae bacterium]
MGKTGIMGGTFDPIHCAHLRMARCAMEQKELDRVLFMPSKIPPHKMGRKVSDEKLRAHLVRLAIEGEENFYYSDFELRREGTTYTAKTLALLKEQQPEEMFYFIMGGDSLFQFANWYHPEEIAQNAVILAVSRGTAGKRQMKEQAEVLAEQFHGRFELIRMEKMEISSSLIREKIAKGESVRQMLPERVYEYIRRNHCYKA